VQVFAFTIVLTSAVYVVLSKRYKAAEQRWAFSDRDRLGVLAESAVGPTNSNFLAAAILGSSRTPARVALRQRRHHQPARSNVSALRVAAQVVDHDVRHLLNGDADRGTACQRTPPASGAS
jgi:hypothetical protein